MTMDTTERIRKRFLTEGSVIGAVSEKRFSSRCSQDHMTNTVNTADPSSFRTLAGARKMYGLELSSSKPGEPLSHRSDTVSETWLERPIHLHGLQPAWTR